MEEKHSDTFLTSLGRQREVDASIPQAESINNLYTDLSNTVMTLDQHVGGILRKHELDFLNHYKEAMYKLQKEMRTLKERANDEESKRRKTEKLEALEKERDKLREQAEKYDKLCSNHKKALETWKQKAQELEDDQKFLKAQIEAAAQQNAVLKNKLSGQKEKHIEIPTEPAPVQLKESPPKEDKHYFAKLQNRFKETANHLQSQLELEKKTLKNLRSTKANYVLEKGELEDVFLQCIEEVKRDISARKMKSARLNIKNTKLHKTNINSASIKLDMFKEPDKRRVMELFLNTEKVRKFLYERMFNQEPEASVRSKSPLPQSASALNLNKQNKKPASTHGLQSHVLSAPHFSKETLSIRRPKSTPFFNPN